MMSYLDLIDEWVSRTRFIVREPADAKEIRLVIADAFEEHGNNIIPPLLRKAKPKRYWPLRSIHYYRLLMTPIEEVWTTERGQIILYKDLGDKHLVNILVYMRLKTTYQFRLQPRPGQLWIAMLMLEAEKRGIRLEAEKAVATAIAKRAGRQSSQERLIFRSITADLSNEDTANMFDILFRMPTD